MTAQIDISTLPAIIDGDYVGITFDHMDYLMKVKYKFESVVETKNLFRESLDVCYSEIEQRDNLLEEKKKYVSMLYGATEMCKDRLLAQEESLKKLEKELKKAKRGRTIAILTGGAFAGLLVGVLLGN